MTARANRTQVSDTLDLLIKVGSPIALVTALLYYFGWVRSDFQARALGFDSTMLTHAPQDYILRSVSVLFLPLLLLLVLSIGAGSLHRKLMHTAKMRRGRNAIGRLAMALKFSWLVAPLAGLILLAWDNGSIGEVLFPFSLTLGVVGTAYGFALGRRLDPRRSRPRFGMTLLVAALIALLLFWDTERVARQMGELFAERITNDVGQLSNVVIYSPKKLHITASGVIETRLGDPDGTYNFRYEGLRLLQRSGGRFFLLHDGWTSETGQVLVIHDDGELRIEFHPD